MQVNDKGSKKPEFTKTLFTVVLLICLAIGAGLLVFLAPPDSYQYDLEKLQFSLFAEIGGAADTIGVITAFAISIAGAFVAIMLAQRSNDLSNQTNELTKRSNDLSQEMNRLTQNQITMEALNFIEHLMAGHNTRVTRAISAALKLNSAAEMLGAAIREAAKRSPEGNELIDFLLADTHIVAARQMLSAELRHLFEVLGGLGDTQDLMKDPNTNATLNFLKDFGNLKNISEKDEPLKRSPFDLNYYTTESLAKRFLYWSHHIVDDEHFRNRLELLAYAIPAYKSDKTVAPIQQKVTLPEFAAKMPEHKWLERLKKNPALTAMLLLGDIVEVKFSAKRLQVSKVEGHGLANKIIASEQGMVITSVGALTLSILSDKLPSLETAKDNAISELEESDILAGTGTRSAKSLVNTHYEKLVEQLPLTTALCHLKEAPEKLVMQIPLARKNPRIVHEEEMVGLIVESISNFYKMNAPEAGA